MSEEVVVAVVGSRTYCDLTDVTDFVQRTKPQTRIISGGAAGVDRTATACARALGRMAFDIPADWDRYGNYLAGFIRNTVLVEQATFVVAFWDGSSRGTLDTIVKALDSQKLHSVYVRQQVTAPRRSYTAVEFDIRYHNELEAARQRIKTRGA